MFENTHQTLLDSEEHSVEALAQAFQQALKNKGKINNNDYQIATTGQYLARKMVAAKDYEKAAEYYATTLQTQVLDELIQNQLTHEYAQVLLELARYAEVVALLDKAPTSDSAELSALSVQTRLLLARADIGLQQYHRVVERLSPLNNQLSTLPDSAIKHAAGLYFQAQATQLAANMMAEIVKRNPNDINVARQLTGLYIQLKDDTRALNLWALTFSKSLFTEEQDWLLLTNLYHRQGSPEKAARLMTAGMENGVISQTPKHYYTLFEYWFRGKETRSAQEALWNSVRGSHNVEHTLILAEMLQKEEKWQKLQQLIEWRCQSILPDPHVGRINLMLGIALHKQNKDVSARRAFINASLVSGVKNSAREWLAFMNAAPATREESAKLWGDCLPHDASIALPKQFATHPNTSSSPAPATASSEAASEFTTKEHNTLHVVTLPATRFYGTKLHTTAQKMTQDITRKTFNLIKNLIRSGGKVKGKMHLLFDEVATQEGIHLTIAFPYSGTPKNRAGNSVIRKQQQLAVSLNYQGPAAQIPQQWQTLSALAIKQGLTPTGQARMIFLNDSTNVDAADNAHIDVTLQLMIQK